MNSPELPEAFIHPQAICESPRIGRGTRIWAFAHVLPGATIGEGCNICDGVFIENDVSVGNRVTVKCGVQLWDGLTLEDDVFVGPNATFTNDPMPRSGQHLSSYPRTIVRSGASIGANATILPGITIGKSAMIGAGAVVTRSVPPFAIVTGNPGRIVRYVAAAPGTNTGVRQPFAIESSVPGVQLINTPIVTDPRGNLIARELGRGTPFVPSRVFVVFSVPSKEIRGEHAHRQCEQLLVCVKGTVQVVCDDGTNRQEFILDQPDKGLYIPPMIWGTQYRYSHDAVLMVLASHTYDAADYIRDYDQFLIEKKA